MTDTRATQVAVEEWAPIIPPQARATQVAIEMWAGAANVSTRVVVTQVAIEEWASVALAPIGQVWAMIMA